MRGIRVLFHQESQKSGAHFVRRQSKNDKTVGVRGRRYDTGVPVHVRRIVVPELSLSLVLQGSGDRTPSHAVSEPPPGHRKVPDSVDSTKKRRRSRAVGSKALLLVGKSRRPPPPVTPPVSSSGLGTSVVPRQKSPHSPFAVPHRWGSWYKVWTTETPERVVVIFSVPYSMGRHLVEVVKKIHLLSRECPLRLGVGARRLKWVLLGDLCFL